MALAAQMIILLYAVALREGMAGVAHVLAEQTALGPLDIHRFHADRSLVMRRSPGMLWYDTLEERRLPWHTAVTCHRGGSMHASRERASPPPLVFHSGFPQRLTRNLRWR